MSERLTTAQLEKISRRWDEEISKKIPFKLLAGLVDGELMIGIYKPDLPLLGLDENFINYLELVRSRNGSLTLTFDEQSRPIIVIKEKEGTQVQNSPDVIAEMQRKVELVIQEYLEIHGNEKLL